MRVPEQNYVATRGFTSNATDYGIADPVPTDLPGFNVIKAKGLVALDNSDEGIRAEERRREIQAAAERGAAIAAQPDHVQILRELEEAAAPARMGDYDEEVESSPEGPRGADFAPDVQTEKVRELEEVAAPQRMGEGGEGETFDNRTLTAEQDVQTLRSLEEEVIEERMGDQSEAQQQHEVAPGVESPQPEQSNPTGPLEGTPLPGREATAAPEDPIRQDGGDRAEEKEWASDEAQQLAEAHGLSLASVEGTGSGGRVKKSDIEQAIKDQENVS